MNATVCSNDRLRQLASAFLRDHSAHGEVLIVAGARAAADDLARSCCDTALFGVHRLSLRELVLAVASGPMNARGLAPLRRIAREALALRVSDIARRQGRLGYLRDSSLSPGFARALARTLQDLRLNALAPEQLREIGRTGSDLAVLLELYESELQERSFADHATRVRLAIDEVGHSEFAGVPVLCLDVRPESTSERAFLRTLAQQSGATLEISLGQDDHRTSTSLESAQRFVLSGDVPPARPPDDSVEFFSASGEALECVEIARRILHSGRPFDRIAILLRSPERHHALVAEALRRAGIPAFFARGSRRPDVAGRAFLCLLRCKEERLSAHRFAEYLSLGQMPAEEGEFRAPIAWENLLADAGVFHGADRWERRLRGATETLHGRYMRCTDETERAHTARRIASLEALTGFALPVIRRLDALPSRVLWGEWIEAFYQLATATLARPRSVHELLEELAPMAETGPVALAEVLLVLERHLLDWRDPEDEDRYGRVFVSGIEEARAMSFELVFVPGLNEGLFPRPVREDPLLLDDQRKTLGIPGSSDDGELLRVALACASQRAVLSWSRIDLATGRERVASFFAFEAAKAARGADVEVAAFLDDARAGSESRLGWPAPADPARAIDNAEYDLATLRLAKDKGDYSWLPRQNEHVRRSLLARLYRWDKTWRYADGLVTDDVQVKALLERWQTGSYPHSATALQQFARCPYKFLLYAIHQLRPADPPEALQRIDAATRGRLFHTIQFRLRSGRDLDDVIQEVAAEAEEELAPAIPQIWLAGIESLRADLRGWMQYRETCEAEWAPVHSELAFGTKQIDECDPRSTDEPVQLPNGSLLRGSIDLIERNGSGVLRVTDHKTGRPPDRRPECIGHGEVLQPLLYALAAAQLLNERVERARLFYSTLRANYRSVEFHVHEGARRTVQKVLSTVDLALGKGFLPAAPREDACRTCEYLPVCGPYEEERIRRKSRPELQPLLEIRGYR